MKKNTIASLGIAFLIIVGAFFYISRDTDTVSRGTGDGEAKIVDGVQIVEISARGGYFPKRTIAQAGIPTIIRMKTNGTFDCSSSLIVPALNYRTILDPSGARDIPLSASQSEGTVRGLCSMGMYGFEIDFR